MTRLVQGTALSLSGLLAGNELGTLIGLHPALRALPLPREIESEQALTDRLGKIMPFSMTATLVAVVAAAVDRLGRPGFGPTAVAAGATASMLAITLVGNVPLNQRTMAYSTAADESGWAAIRRRWERLHVIRVALDLTSFGCLVAAALHADRR